LFARHDLVEIKTKDALFSITLTIPQQLQNEILNPKANT